MKDVINFFKSSRSTEVAMMLGFPATGVLFAFSKFEQLVSLPVIVFVMATFALSLAIYAFNAWAGAEEDIENERLPELKRKKSFFIKSTALFVVIFISLYLLINPMLALFSVASFLLWALYSFPKKGFKYKPVAGTFIHFIGQVLHFQMGFSVLSVLNYNSFLISFYFALLFCAGHINHELIDYESDKKMGTKTGAVYFGKEKWEKLSFLIFSFSTLYILTLTLFKAADIILVWSFILAGVIHAAYKLMLCSGNLSKERFLKERKFYRFIYFLAGTLFIVTKALSLPHL
ncbi:MAG: UbiA family prenyltransferase [bacterium]